ncbi:ABC transporter permease subunit [Streptomyces sp. NPDC050636]|uniref:ABC transporter permease subunit n=1 Tax=Streptomyces sp. NPDC050636 TaxID=3154510 RepID=UPI00341CFD6A
MPSDTVGARETRGALDESAAPPDGTDTTVPRIVPRRRTGQWATAAAVLVLLALAVNSVVRNDAFQWDVVADYFLTTAVLRGLGLTLWLTVLVMTSGFVLGTLLAAMRLSANPVLRGVSWGYVWLFRSMPILVQLLFWFNIGALYPTILGVKTVNLLGPVAIAVIGLTLHEAVGHSPGADTPRLLLWVSPQQLGGTAAGYAVDGRGGIAAGQPMKRQPSLLDPESGRGVWPHSVRGCQHRTYQVANSVRSKGMSRCVAGGLRGRTRAPSAVQRHYARGTAGAR